MVAAQRADGPYGGPPLRVTIVLEPAVAALLDVSQLTTPDTQVAVEGGTVAMLVANAPLLRRTDVLIVQVDPGNPREFEEFERFVTAHTGAIPVVAAVKDLSVAVTRRVLRSDAADVLPIPFSADELHQAIETGRHRRVVALPKVQRRSGHIVSFLGALGGIGTTSIAAQAGMAWAETAKVVLIDLDVQFGNAALYLNLRPALSVADLIDAGDRMDAELLRSVAEKHRSGLDVIACPPDIVPLDMMSPDQVEKLLDLAAQTWDVVLIDLPGAWVSWSAAALSRSDAIALVTELSVAGVHQARRQIEVIEANGLHDRIRIVLNRLVRPMFGKADLTDAESSLRRKVDHVVTNDYTAMTAAIDEGKPLGSIKLKSRIEKDIRTMVATMADAVSAERALR